MLPGNDVSLHAKRNSDSDCFVLDLPAQGKRSISSCIDHCMEVGCQQNRRAALPALSISSMISRACVRSLSVNRSIAQPASRGSRRAWNSISSLAKPLDKSDTKHPRL